MESTINIKQMIDNAQAQLNMAWMGLPPVAAKSMYVRTMVDTINTYISEHTANLVQSGQAKDFIYAAIDQNELDLALGSILPIVEGRVKGCKEAGTGLCLFDIVRDVVSEIAINQAVVHGADQGYFERDENGVINLKD